MTKKNWIILGVAAAVAAGGFYYWYTHRGMTRKDALKVLRDPGTAIDISTVNLEDASTEFLIAWATAFKNGNFNFRTGSKMYAVADGHQITADDQTQKT